MKPRDFAVIVMCAALFTGCVTSATHKDAVDELAAMRKASEQMAAEFDSFKEQAAAELGALQQDKSRLANELQAVQAAEQQVRQALDETNASLNREQEIQEDLRGEIAKLQNAHEQLQRMNQEVKEERDLLLTQIEDLQNQTKDLAAKLDAKQSQLATQRQDQQRVMGDNTSLLDRIARLQKLVGELEGDAARARQERDLLAAALQEKGDLLRAQEAEKGRLEQERATKEAEIERLTRTHAELTRSLQDEIAKGDIRIRQVRDRLRINMVDRVLFDSGQGYVKPAGLKVLKRMSAILKNVTDKQIRIEGHTDNVPIGVKLQDRFPTNWELSTARATSVVRYLTEKGGVVPANISAIGYAETRPVADNETEEGRRANRRIEILLYPKDLSEIADHVDQ
ncbi:MAG: OmpA family protein [Nitrospirae bacterium]|nr:OmpA family protein [Nitrospirota bacterium]